MHLAAAILGALGLLTVRWRIYYVTMAPFHANYERTLAGHDAELYEEKIDFCGGVDPYETDMSEFSENKDHFPDVVREDLIKHLCLGVKKLCTLEQLKCHKALQAHNYVTSGFVHFVRAKRLNNGRVVMIGKVRF